MAFSSPEGRERDTVFILQQPAVFIQPQDLKKLPVSAAVFSMCECKPVCLYHQVLSYHTSK